MCEPAVVSGSINRRPCATHVKFMYCAALTKEAWNGFWGKIMPEQREDGAEENKTDKRMIQKRKKVNVPLRREEENDPCGQVKG